ncbi:MAG: hypothetical protein QGD89_01265 [Actinomycetota bacterium]|nr:hypothetical protein [Actinomycetota bacterium]
MIVQIGFLILARSAAATSLEAALRRAVVAETEVAVVQSALSRDVLAVVPGAEDLTVAVTGDETSLRGVVTFRWVPPGPDFIPVTVSIERSVVRVVPP